MPIIRNSRLYVCYYRLWCDVLGCWLSGVRYRAAGCASWKRDVARRFQCSICMLQVCVQLCGWIGSEWWCRWLLVYEKCQFLVWGFSWWLLSPGSWFGRRIPAWGWTAGCGLWSQRIVLWRHDWCGRRRRLWGCRPRIAHKMLCVLNPGGILRGIVLSVKIFQQWCLKWGIPWPLLWWFGKFVLGTQSSFV